MRRAKIQSLNDEEEQAYQQLIREVYPEVSEMITNPLFEQGIQQGKQSLLLQQLSAKFGRLPEPVSQKIIAITGEQELNQLSLKSRFAPSLRYVRILTANSLDEMGLNSRGNSD